MSGMHIVYYYTRRQCLFLNIEVVGQDIFGLAY